MELQLNVSLDTQAFRDEEGYLQPEAVADFLAELAQTIYDEGVLKSVQRLHDVNGNSVGEYRINE